MMQFKENADLMCILHIDWFLTHDHKTCGILSVIADILSQDLQSVKLSCLSAGNSCLRLVIVFFYLLGRTGTIVAEGKAAAEAERASKLRQADAQIADLTRTMCAKVLERNLTQQDDARMLDDLLQKAGESDGKRV